MFRLEKSFKAEEGYYVVEVHNRDKVFADGLIKALEKDGWHVYSYSNLDESRQYSFVNSEFKELLEERLMRSCRNSLGSL